MITLMRPTLLQRYVLKEFLPPFGLGLLVFTFILILNHLFYMIDLFLNRGVEMETILKMMSLVLPMFIPLSIPMAALLAALIAYGRLSEDGELTALRSAGMPHSKYTWPNVFFGLILSLFLVHFNLNLAPRATAEFKKMHYLVAQRNPLALFAPKVMNNFGEYKVIVDKMDRRKKKLSGISIYHINPVGSPTRIFAPDGEIDTSDGFDLTLTLTNGAVHQPNPDKENEYTITRFNRFVLRIAPDMEGQQRTSSPREMTYGELKEKIQSAIKEKAAVAPLKTEYHLRIAVAFAPLVFIAFGTVLGIQLKKGSKSMSVGMSLVVILVYYGLFVLMISLSSQGFFSSFVLTWLPNFITMGAAVLLWARLARQ